MLHLETLESTITWLEARKAQYNSPANWTPKEEIFDSLIHELASKTSDIRCAIQAGGKYGHLIEEGKGTERKKSYRCPFCNSKRTVYRVYFPTSMVGILEKILRYCVDHRTHKIEIRNLKNLTRSEYTNFGKLQSFGLVYREKTEDGKRIKGGHYGVAIRRIRDFLDGKWAVAEYSESDTQTKRKQTSENRVFIHEIRQDKKNPYNKEALLPYFIQYDELEESGFFKDTPNFVQ